MRSGFTFVRGRIRGLFVFVRRHGKTLNLVVNLLILTTAIAGTYVGYSALGTYKTQNRINMNVLIEDLDNRMLNLALEKDKRYLLSFFYFEPEEGLSVRQRADAMIASIFDEGMTIDQSWKTIAELYAQLYIPENKHKEEYRRMTEALVASERMLYMTYITYEAWKGDMITEDEWEDIATYVSDFGNSPYFLMAVYVGHRYGYFNENFAEELRRRLKLGDDSKEMINLIYPEITAEGWVKELKERREKRKQPKPK